MKVYCLFFQCGEYSDKGTMLLGTFDSETKAADAEQQHKAKVSELLGLVESDDIDHKLIAEDELEVIAGTSYTSYVKEGAYFIESADLNLLKTLNIC